MAPRTIASVIQMDTPLHRSATEHHQAGRLQEAQLAYHQILQSNSDDAMALHGLGLIALTAGNGIEALNALRKAVAAQPRIGDYRLHLGIAYDMTGDTSAAETELMEAVRLSPGNLNARYNLGHFLLNAGNAKGAIKEFRRVVKKQAGNTDALLNLGIAYIQDGDSAQAFRCFNRCLQLNSSDTAARLNLGNAFQIDGRFDDAITEYDRILEADPNNGDAQYHLGVARKSTGDAKGAIDNFRQVLLSQPEHIAALNNLGTTLYDFADKQEALNSLEKVNALVPENAVFRFNLAATQCKFNEWEKSEETYRSALEIDEEFKPALTNLANLLRDTGRIDDALLMYRNLLVSAAELPSAHSDYLFNLNYVSDDDNSQIYDKSLEWNRRHGTPANAKPRLFGNDASPDRRLKIGYVSPDFYTHSIGYFFEPLLSRHLSENVETYCYSDTIQNDDMTGRLAAAADHWRSIIDLSDQQVTEQITSDGIDILVDLVGHGAANRLTLFAMKPAPVLLTWLGYPNTTGLAAMDYRLTDDIADPEGQSDLVHSEKLFRIPDGFLCYQPPSEAPEVCDPPHLKNGIITFGSFNNLAKISPAAIEAWANILNSIPDSRLIIKGLSLSSQTAQERFFAQFVKLDVGRDRIDLVPRADSIQEHLSYYDRVDIALDTFPYNGTTTTFEALWMGVPVICLMGNRHAARVSGSILTRLDLPELIAVDTTDYVQRAITLAENAPRLMELRRDLREIHSNSSLSNPIDFAGRMESCYREVWRDWCISRV
ncbi:MAG: tetratricopeptide repeat protein [Rhodospirillaceae bacterium]|jgi:protein O-GlcNAc transferase|nr:tetratricopeptide repeat protein [Rhodospirillaceae bacterium]